MRKSSEQYIEFWQDNSFVKVNVLKALNDSQYDQIGSIELPVEIDQWTNKETYSAFLRWAADRIDEVPYNRPTYEGDTK